MSKTGKLFFLLVLATENFAKVLFQKKNTDFKLQIEISRIQKVNRNKKNKKNKKQKKQNKTKTNKTKQNKNKQTNKKILIKRDKTKNGRTKNWPYCYCREKKSTAANPKLRLINN